MLARGRLDVGGDEGASTLRVSFKSSRGLRLAGELMIPGSGGPHPIAVFAHDRGSGKANPLDRAVARALVADGTAAFLFDFIGHGESEGTPEDCTAPQQVEDLRAAVDVLEGLDEVDAARTGLAGTGSGAAAVLGLAAEDRRVRALVLRSVSAEGVETTAARVSVPTLVMVGEADAPSRVATARLLERLSAPCRLEVVPEGDPQFGDPGALGRAAALTAAWFRRHLGRPRDAAPER